MQRVGPPLRVGAGQACRAHLLAVYGDAGLPVVEELAARVRVEDLSQLHPDRVRTGGVEHEPVLTDMQAGVAVPVGAFVTITGPVLVGHRFPPCRGDDQIIEVQHRRLGHQQLDPRVEMLAHARVRGDLGEQVQLRCAQHPGIDRVGDTREAVQQPTQPFHPGGLSGGPVARRPPIPAQTAMTILMVEPVFTEPLPEPCQTYLEQHTLAIQRTPTRLALGRSHRLQHRIIGLHPRTHAPILPKGSHRVAERYSQLFRLNRRYSTTLITAIKPSANG